MLMVSEEKLRKLLDKIYQLGEENENRMERGMKYISVDKEIDKCIEECKRYENP